MIKRISGTEDQRGRVITEVPASDPGGLNPQPPGSKGRAVQLLSPPALSRKPSIFLLIPAGFCSSSTIFLLPIVSPVIPPALDTGVCLVGQFSAVDYWMEEVILRLNPRVLVICTFSFTSLDCNIIIINKTT